MSYIYEKTTSGISVSVEPAFLDDRSRPDDHKYFWAYRVRLHNQGDETVQLKSRYWRITDGSGVVQEVQGDGVIGEQPVLEPGGSYEYTSGTPLNTPSGIMLGHYNMTRPDGTLFPIEIPAFSLDSPFQSNIHH